MTEIPADSKLPIEQEGDVPRIIRWEKTPDPIVKEAAEAIFRHREHQHHLNPNHLTSGEGIFLLPNWSGSEILKVGQRRGIKDLWPRGSSAHDVTFCVAETRNSNGKIHNRHVAIKKFHRAASAIKDAVNNAVVLQRDFTTTNPIAVVIDGLTGYVITPAIQGVQPLDTEPWHQFNIGTEPIRRHFIGRLQQTGKVLADLNSKGINHSDAQIKNFWVTVMGKMEPFDWEAAKIYPNPPGPQDLLAMGIDDLRTLYLSVTNQYQESPIPALLGSKKTQWLQFKDYILGPYGDRLMQTVQYSDQLSEEELLNIILEIAENLKRQFNIED